MDQATVESDEPRWWRWLVLGVLAGAVALRLVAAASTPLTGDEQDHVNTALLYRTGLPGEVDKNPPEGTLTETRHPLLSIALIRVPLTLGADAPFFVRLPFVLLSVPGLVCVYLLARRAFGRWPALLALVLLSVDQFHLIRSRTATEAVALAFVAPILYAFYCAVTDNRPNLLVVVGILAGIGYHGKEDTLLLVLAMGLFLLVSRSRRHWFRRKELYVASFVVAAFVLLDVYFNAIGTAGNLQHLSGRLAKVGVTLRAVSLYLGELILRTLPRPAEFVWFQDRWDWEIAAMNWAAGLLCLTGAIYATAHRRNESTRLLLWVFWIVFAAATVVSPTHGLLEINQKKWAGASLIAAAILTGDLIYRRARHWRPGRIVAVALLGYLIGNGIRISLVRENIYSVPAGVVHLKHLMRVRRWKANRPTSVPQRRPRTRP